MHRLKLEGIHHLKKMFRTNGEKNCILPAKTHSGLKLMVKLLTLGKIQQAPRPIFWTVLVGGFLHEKKH